MMLFCTTWNLNPLCSNKFLSFTILCTIYILFFSIFWRIITLILPWCIRWMHAYLFESYFFVYFRANSVFQRITSKTHNFCNFLLLFQQSHAIHEINEDRTNSFCIKNECTTCQENYWMLQPKCIWCQKKEEYKKRVWTNKNITRFLNVQYTWEI